MTIEYFPNTLTGLESDEEPKLYSEISQIEYSEFNGRLVRGKYCTPRECLDVLNFCLDVDKCLELGLNPVEYINILGNKIGVIIITNVWEELIRAMASVGFNGTLVINYWEKLRYVPSGMRKAYQKYVHELGGYISWALSMDELVKKHNKRVLFGAGNMCRNYMLMYGDEYPPLFTCDNNSSRWGETIDGLVIKNPEELKSLDEDVAVYICNMYWDEIESQLKAMGIKNPIEKFNDEFLPKKHIERMEMWKGNK